VVVGARLAAGSTEVQLPTPRFVGPEPCGPTQGCAGQPRFVNWAKNM